MTRTREVNKRRIAWIVILVAVLAYAFGEPYLERWLGIDLPSIRQTRPVAKETVDEDHQNGRPFQIPGRAETLGKRAAVSSRDEFDPDQFRPFLKPTGKKERWRSPAGLVYGMGPGGVHRLQHVMRHAVDNPERELHSVFDGGQQEILRQLDQAYRLIQTESDRVETRPDEKLPFRVRYTVDMGQRVGYLGGRLGRRKNYPPRDKIALVLDNGKFMVSAYPER